MSLSCESHRSFKKSSSPIPSHNCRDDVTIFLTIIDIARAAAIVRGCR